MRISLLFFTVIALIMCGCNNKHQATQEQNEVLHHGVGYDQDVDNNDAQKSTTRLKKELTETGYQIFDYVDSKTGDTILMQQYFMAFLKRGPKRSQDSVTAAKLQEAHLAHLGRMYEEGYADISGPFGDDQDIRGITIYNVPTLEMADSLANLDPMVKAGRLEIEVRPWWAAKGFPLR